MTPGTMTPGTMTPGAAVVDVAGRYPRPVAWVALTIVVVGGKGLLFNDPRAWPYVIVLVVVTSGTAMVAAGGRVSGRVVAMLAALASVHAVGGLALAPGETDVSFYEFWLVDGIVKVDQLVHAAGTAVVTLAAAELLDRWMLPTVVRLRWIFAGSAACGIGALNEVFEFLMAERIDTLRVGDGTNMGWDLVFNLAGAAAVVLGACLAVGRRDDVAPGPVVPVGVGRSSGSPDR